MFRDDNYVVGLIVSLIIISFSVARLCRVTFSHHSIYSECAEFVNI